MTELPVDLEWGCEDCEFCTTVEADALAHSDEYKHSLAVRPRTQKIEGNYTMFPPTVRRVGDPRGGAATWSLMPVADPNLCSQCAVAHGPEEPHDQQSLFYKMAFQAEHGRWPSWRDAVAHCSPNIQEAWIRLLEERGVDVEVQG